MQTVNFHLPLSPFYFHGICANCSIYIRIFNGSKASVMPIASRPSVPAFCPMFVVLKTVETLGNRCPSYSPYQQCPGLVQDECSCHADCDEANKYMCCFDGCRRRCRLTNATNASMYLNGLNLECVFFFPGSQHSREFVECWVFLNCAQVLQRIFLFSHASLYFNVVLLFVYRQSLCLIRGLFGTHGRTISVLFPTA